MTQHYDTTNPPNVPLHRGRWRLGRTLAVGTAAGLVAIATLSFSGTLAASKDDGPRRCSNRTLRGDYGLLINGNRPLPSGEMEAFVGTAIRTFDGHGGFTQIDNTQYAIAGFVRNVPAYGTYEVNADCSGTTAIFFPGAPAAVDTAFVIVANGDEGKDAAPNLTTALWWRVAR